MGARSGWFTVQSETCFSSGRQQPEATLAGARQQLVELVLDLGRGRTVGSVLASRGIGPAEMTAAARRLRGRLADYPADGYSHSPFSS
jgi:hypothetical protein